MSGYVLTPQAQADVAEIWDYTAERWSREQAASYLRAIRDACEDLACCRRISRPVDVKLGYFKATVKSHLIIFRRDDAGLVMVVRILHGRMDVERHLR
ncbi:type II toxin-antitoxin system RelE/ParE family toxin [Methylobacterium oryzisoli]|uniref:type II toxin-antitoxin system RelE/ParE family toxin n=1 Tax=Methylobacterium oryzisoli TaxID=3385502 RepID=UPI0038920156